MLFQHLLARLSVAGYQRIQEIVCLPQLRPATHVIGVPHCLVSALQSEPYPFIVLPRSRFVRGSDTGSGRLSDNEGAASASTAPAPSVSSSLESALVVREDPRAAWYPMNNQGGLRPPQPSDRPSDRPSVRPSVHHVHRYCLTWITTTSTGESNASASAMAVTTNPPCINKWHHRSIFNPLKGTQM